MKHIVLTLGLLMSFSLVFSQVYPKNTVAKTTSQNDILNAKYADDPKFKEIYTEAENYIVLENYFKAMPLFLLLDSLYPNNANINFNIGVCYINSSAEKNKAAPYLEKAVKNVSLVYTGNYNESAAPVFAYYYLAKAYHIIYRLDDAIKFFKMFETYLNPQNDALLVKDVKRQIEMCYNAKKIINNPLGIKIENVGNKINSAFPDYSPIITKDGYTMFFTSRRENSTGGKVDQDGKYYEDIYISTRPKDGNWSEAKQITGKINSSGHEATISVAPDNKSIFIYKDDNGDGNIYLSKLEEGDWSVPKKLGSNVNTKYWETHASVSSDESILYFTSNRPGGFGGRDIYKSYKQSNGEWGPAQNLGESINSSEDEDAPFISDDGVTLYFSSKGHESMGGFDIFTSTLSEDGFWSEAENIGYPINSTSDDVFYLPVDENHAYYSSVKSRGFGEKDIYLISIVSKKRQLIALSGVVKDAASFKPIEAQIEIIDKLNNEVVANLISDPKTGEYSVTLMHDKRYAIRVASNNYNKVEEELVINADEILLEINKDFMLEKAATAEGKRKIDKSEFEVGMSIRLKNIYYDYDKATLRPESVNELSKLISILEEIPTMKIEIASHTDSNGSDEYNLDLSARRAKSVVDFLIANGIDKSRLTSRGYGETLPISTNSTNEGRQKNRRTDFKILSL
ncbi:MAG: OmpA family protein [Bacteroidota bacterium]